MKPTILSDKLRSKLEKCLNDGCSFFMLRMPGKVPRLVTDPDGEIRIDLVGWRKPLSDAIRVGSTAHHDIVAPAFPQETSRLKYMARVGYLIEKLKKRGTAKTVISRVITGQNPAIDWIETALALWNEFPDAVGYLFFTPVTGYWLGATPEKLLGGSYPAHFTTVALAGTLPADAPWNVKVYEEQQMVEQFITNLLRPIAEDLRISKPRECVYGPIKHLVTTFSGNLAAPSAMKTLIDALSPTPALSGLPREEAFADIESIEDHHRDMYGGYFLIKEGRTETVDWTTFNAFVIIRCLRFDPATGRWAIYSGGGVTNMSDASEEWDETNQKAARLLSILSRFT